VRVTVTMLNAACDSQQSQLIIVQPPWSLMPSRTAGVTLVGVRVGANEVAQRQVKQDGGQWLPSPCLGAAV
jgi:hypothetical protein